MNNAGTDEFGFFTETDPGLWERVLAVNLVGVLACTHAVLPGMQQAGYGRIVNIASEANGVGSKGSAVYSAAKGGVIAFTKRDRARGRPLRRHGELDARPTETLLMGALEFGEFGQKIVDMMKAGTQLRRLGQPEEVAAAVAFLASDDASYVTGETLGVSGGLGMAQGRPRIAARCRCATPFPSLERPSEPTLAPGLERLDEFDAADRLLTDAGGTIGVKVLSTLD